MRLQRTRPFLRYGYLKNISTAQIAYATQASKAAFIVSENRDLESEVQLEILAENSEHFDGNMYVAFHERNTPKLMSITAQSKLWDHEVTLQDVCIEFEEKHSYFSMLVRALNKMNIMTIKRIVPNLKDFFRPTLASPMELLLHQLPEIDQDQLNALHKIISCDSKSPPIIVNGSFGAGKTRLLAVTTNCIIRHGKKLHVPMRVLICAHHQVSADHFIEEYFGKMFKNMTNVELARVTSLKHRPSPYSEYSNYYITNPDYIKSYNRFHQEHSMYLVVVTTFNTAPHLTKIFKAGVFTHILIDEGAQVREPEAIAPLCLAGPDTKIVIAGDSCQVCLINK